MHSNFLFFIFSLQITPAFFMWKYWCQYLIANFPIQRTRPRAQNCFQKIWRKFTNATKTLPLCYSINIRIRNRKAPWLSEFLANTPLIKPTGRCSASPKHLSVRRLSLKCVPLSDYGTASFLWAFLHLTAKEFVVCSGHRGRRTINESWHFGHIYAW